MAKKKSAIDPVQEARNNAALALEISVEVAKSVFGSDISPSVQTAAALGVFDRLERDEDGAADTDQSELIEQLKQSRHIAKELLASDGIEATLGAYDRVFGETLNDKLGMLVEAVEALADAMESRLDEKDDEDDEDEDEDA